VEAEDIDNNQSYDYVMYRDAVMRKNTTQAPMLSAGYQPSFYGPLTGNRVTRESFLQGRGHTSSKCPDCEVVYLPASLFPDKNVVTPCERVDMQPMYTRVPKSCNSISEVDTFAYQLMPGHYMEGYQGMNSVTSTHIQTRVPPEQPQPGYKPCATNYGSYAKSDRFKPYM